MQRLTQSVTKRSLIGEDVARLCELCLKVEIAEEHCARKGKWQMPGVLRKEANETFAKVCGGGDRSVFTATGHSGRLRRFGPSAGG